MTLKHTFKQDDTSGVITETLALPNANANTSGATAKLVIKSIDLGTNVERNVNVSNNAVFLSGHSAVQYQVSSSGPVALTGVKNPLFGSAACSTALKNLVTAPSTHLFENEYSRVMSRSHRR